MSFTGEIFNGGEVRVDALFKRFPVGSAYEEGIYLMTSFSVWAPNAKRVEVELATPVIPMTAGENGWWTAELDDIGKRPDTDYMFLPRWRTPAAGSPFSVAAERY